MKPIAIYGAGGFAREAACAQAHGAAYKGRPVGSMGDAAAFSLCQDKIITTGGEGGMVTTNSRDVWEKVWSYKDHGKSFDAVYNRQSPPGFRWLHESFGTNWRMTEFQAAIGRIQLRKLPQWTALRQRNAAILMEGFSGISGLRVTVPPPEICHAWYKCYVCAAGSAEAGLVPGPDHGGCLCRGHSLRVRKLR